MQNHGSFLLCATFERRREFLSGKSEREELMKRLLLYGVVACLLLGTMALAQTGSQSSSTSSQSGSSAQQQPSGSQSQSAQPSQNSTSASGSASTTRQNSGSGNTPSNSSASSSTSTNGPTSANGPRTARTGGVPWLWIVLGGAILLIVIVSLVARGSGSTTYVERTEHHDETRRAS
jgi:Flp pilus assembly protein TadB